jgi:hypothetical protein
VIDIIIGYQCDLPPFGLMSPGLLAGPGLMCVFGARPVRRLSFPLGVHITVFSAQIYAIVACAKGYIRRAYTGEHIYVRSDDQAAFQAIDTFRVMLKLVKNVENHHVLLLCIVPLKWGGSAKCPSMDASLR